MLVKESLERGLYESRQDTVLFFFSDGEPEHSNWVAVRFLALKLPPCMWEVIISFHCTTFLPVHISHLVLLCQSRSRGAVELGWPHMHTLSSSLYLLSEMRTLHREEADQQSLAKESWLSVPWWMGSLGSLKLYRFLLCHCPGRLGSFIFILKELRLTMYVVPFKKLLQKQALLTLEPKSASDCFP